MNILTLNNLTDEDVSVILDYARERVEGLCGSMHRVNESIYGLIQVFQILNGQLCTFEEIEEEEDDAIERKREFESKIWF